MKDIPIPQLGLSPDMLSAIQKLTMAVNENLTELHGRINNILGLQGEAVFLGDINMSGHRIRNVETRDSVDATTEQGLIAVMGGPLLSLDDAIWWMEALEEVF